MPVLVVPGTTARGALLFHGDDPYICSRPTVLPNELAVCGRQKVTCTLLHRKASSFVRTFSLLPSHVNLAAGGRLIVT
jgi:hypothetical protein